MSRRVVVNPVGNNLVREAGGLAAVRLGIRVIGILTGWVVARVIGPEGLGQLSIPNLILVTAPFLSLGFPDGLLRELPLAGQDPTRERRLVESAWFVTLLLALLAGLGALLLSDHLAHWFSDIRLLWLALAAGVCNAAFKVSYCDLTGRRRIADLALLQLIQGGLRATAVLLLLFILQGSQRVYAFHAGVTLSLLASVLWASRHGALAWPRPHAESLSHLWRSGPALALASLFLLLLITGDRLVMTRVLSVKMMGLYEQGVLIRDGLLMLPAVLQTILVPSFAARLGQPELRPGVLAEVGRQTGLLAVLAPVFLGLVTLQLPWLFGLLLPRFLPGLVLFQLTTLSMCPVFLTYIPASLWMSEGRSLSLGLLAAICLGGILLLDLLGPAGVLSDWLHRLPQLESAGLTDFPRALTGALAALLGFWVFALALLLGSARHLGCTSTRVLGWLLPSVILTLAALPALACGWLDTWNPWVNGIALVAAALFLLHHERRTGQLSKVWRARHAVNS